MAGGFVKNVQSELKKVVWPTKKQLIRNSVMVILLIVAFAAVVLTFDILVKNLDQLLWNFLGK